MPKYPKLTANECEKLLLQNGFLIDRQKGSHKIYKKDNLRITLPHHIGKTLHPKIIKQVFDIIKK